MMMKLNEVIPKSNIKYKFKIAEWKKNNKEYSKIIKNNINYKNIHCEERCFIFGNGPSLNNVNFKKFENEYVFTCNQISRREDFKYLKSNYHIWSDSSFFNFDPENENERKILSVMRGVNTSDNRPLNFFEITSKKMVDRESLDKEIDIVYFADCGADFTGISDDIIFDKPTPSFPTVIQYAITLAVYMGFKEIYLLGCDCSIIANTISAIIGNNEKVQYGYKVDKNEFERMHKAKSNVSLKKELYNNARLFDYYEMLYNYCQNRNVKLVNLTQGSLLDTIPKEDIREVIKGYDE